MISKTCEVNGETVGRKGDWIQTATGKKFWPLDPHPEDLCIEDIALSLAKICRFGGHCVEMYSVGQHCVLGSQVVEARTQDPQQALAFLLHDASEAYLGDVTRPLKNMAHFSFYREAERYLCSVIEARYGVLLDTDIVHKVDNEMLATERRDLMVPVPGWSKESEPLEMSIVPWDWQKTAKEYLMRFTVLSQQVKVKQAERLVLNEAIAWVGPRSALPQTPCSQKLRDAVWDLLDTRESQPKKD